MLKTESLTKYYGTQAAVDGVSIELGERGVYGLLGPNGSGKSTLIKMVCGSLKPSRGNVYICGHDLAMDPIRAKMNLGYVQETCILYKEFKVKSYLSMVARLKRIPRSKMKDELEYVIRACNLEPVLEKTIGAVSKGYRQRVGIAQAILGHPKVLLMDEPTSSLDPAQAMDINNLIKEIAKENLVFLSTHLLSEASTVCENIFVMKNGKIYETLLRVNGNQWASKNGVPAALDNIVIEMFK